MQILKLLKNHAVFGFAFTLAKATVYFVPLLLADVLSESDFGVLEYALAGLGMIVNTLINLGVPGAYPYFILRKKRRDLKATFSLHPIILLIPFVINQIVYFGFNLDINFYLAFNISYIIANQVFYSTQFKSHERSTIAVFFDSGVYLILLAFFLLSRLDLVSIGISTINKFILLYSLVYVMYAIYGYFKNKTSILITDYKTILNFSVHLLISTFLIFLITTSGRILVELFFDFETVGVYAFYFRLAAIVVMIHQVVNIAFFKKIYTFDPRVLDRYYFLFFIFIFTLSIIIFLCAPYLVNSISEYFSKTYMENRVVYFLLSAQMVMWIASALNSNIIDRENLAARNNTRFLLLIVLSSIALFLLKDVMTLSLLTFCHLSVIFLANIIQYFSLYKKEIYFLKSMCSLIVIYLIICGCYIFIF